MADVDKSAVADVNTGAVSEEIARLEQELADKKAELEAARRKQTFLEYPKYIMDPDDSTKGVTVASAEEEGRLFAARDKARKNTGAPVVKTSFPKPIPDPSAPDDRSRDRIVKSQSEEDDMRAADDEAASGETRTADSGRFPLNIPDPANPNDETRDRVVHSEAEEKAVLAEDKAAKDAAKAKPEPAAAKAKGGK